MSDLPKFVEFHEEGPREGFQIEPKTYPLEDRIKLIDAISGTGVKSIQVASFVSPKAVPPMADAEQLFAGITKRDGVQYRGLWLNMRGFERAQAVPQVDLEGDLHFYASSSFSQRNNNCSAEEMRDRQVEWLDAYLANGIEPNAAYIMTAFGCLFEGDTPISAVTDLVQWIKSLFASKGLKLPTIYLADTVGWASPEDLKRRIGGVRDLVPEARIGLHLHDTRGLGAANVYAALEMGVDLFDASLAGLGGCPFAGFGDSHGAGNICTEDMVFMCHELGIETGIDLDALIDAAKLAEGIIGRPLNGRIMHAGSLNSYRN